MLAVNEARTERALNDRHGTGQSALDGIIRATDVLLAGHTVVVLGYGWAGQGVAERARGAGAAVIVCEVDPLRALEARMAGYEVMPALDAAERGDVFVTVTGSRRVLRGEHFERMKDGALLANAGHFDVEIDLAACARWRRTGRPRGRPLVEQYELADGRRLNLLAQRPGGQPGRRRGPSGRGDGRLVRAPGAVRRGAGARARELAPGVHPVPAAIDREVGRLKLEALGVEIDEPTAEQGPTASRGADAAAAPAPRSEVALAAPWRVGERPAARGHRSRWDQDRGDRRRRRAAGARLRAPADPDRGRPCGRGRRRWWRR